MLLKYISGIITTDGEIKRRESFRWYRLVTVELSHSLLCSCCGMASWFVHWTADTRCCWATLASGSVRPAIEPNWYLSLKIKITKHQRLITYLLPWHNWYLLSRMLLYLANKTSPLLLSLPFNLLRSIFIWFFWVFLGCLVYLGEVHMLIWLGWK